MNLRVLIADDEPLALARLRACLDRTPGVELVGCAGDGDAAAQQIHDLKPDVVLLDIQMPGRSGLTLARCFTAVHPRPEIVFVTAFAEFAPEAFDLEATDYLLKPVRFDRVQEAIRRAARRLQAGRLDAQAPPPAPPASSQAYDTELWIPQRDGFVRVRIEQIQRIEAARDYALLHTASRTHILRITMAELERRIDPARLLRVHRSAFVRLDLVRRVERSGQTPTRLHVEDGAVIDVGASYARRVTLALGLEGSLATATPTCP